MKLVNVVFKSVFGLQLIKVNMMEVRDWLNKINLKLLKKLTKINQINVK